MTNRNRTTLLTSYMKKLFVITTVLSSLSGGAYAAPPPQPQTETEVTYLLEFVQASACQFNRNDTWYNGKDARLHLEMKYDSLVSKGSIIRAEDFIDKAASKSSLSGRNYQIRCQDGKTISSAQWFTDELKRYRKDKK